MVVEREELREEHPATRFVRSIQKYVLARPAHARLPAERPVGASCVLIRKVSPQPLRMPGNRSTSLDSPGAAVLIAEMSSGAMWFCAMRSTVSRCKSWAPFRLPPCMIICVKVR